MLSLYNFFSESLNGKTDLGKVSATGDNIAKTIKALADQICMDIRLLP